ncbi:MAG: efflux RND transporter periplasmic adaptor subunit [Chthoniobacterales bacterium]
MTSHDPTPPPARRGSVRSWIARLLPLAVIAGALALGYTLIQTPPRAESQRPARQATLVDVAPVAFRTEPVRVEAMGTVQPAQTVDLMPRVGGEIEWINPDFVPGGLFSKGADLVRIEAIDYELARRAADKSLTEARTNLRIEEGAQNVAREDFELLGDVVGEDDRDLVLRKPQLDMAKATVAAAEADLERARIDLARTTVAAPFNAIIEGRPLNVGARVTPTTTLATLIGTDHYWIEVTLPVNELKWLVFPGPSDSTSSTATIFDDAAWSTDASRTGRVKRLAASLESEGRMARVIVEVADPLGIADPDLPRLLIGSYVRVEFQGRELEDVARLPRAYLHENDQVHVFATDETLDIREVTVGLRARDHVVITAGLEPSDRIITTNLPAPVQGMPLRVETPVVQ